MVVRRVSDLGELSDAERKVLAELDTGEDIEIGESVPEQGDERRRVRAALIRLLLLGDDPDPKFRLHEKGLRIRGAWIPDRLDLEGCRELRDVALIYCRFGEAPRLLSAELHNLCFDGSHLPGLFADGLEAKGGVYLRDIESSAEVRLPNAKIGMNLECDGATFRAVEDGQGNPGGVFFADGLESGGSLFLRGVRANGEVRLFGAKIREALDCNGATFRAEKDAQGNQGNALVVDRVCAGGDMFLRRVDARGEVRLLGAKIGGNLECDGATFRAEKDAQGNPREAFSADWLEVGGNVSLEYVEATGEMRLAYVKIGGNLECVSASFRAAMDAKGYLGTAFYAEGLEASGNVFLRRVEALGEVRLLGAKLRGDLDCTGARFRADKGGALSLNRIRVNGAFFSRQGSTVEGVLDLTSAEFGSICDDAKCWPGQGELILERCRYGAFTGGPTDALSRLDWLSRQNPTRWGEDFWPQPYEQLAKVLREMGHGGDARTVLVEKERLQRMARRKRFGRIWRWWLGFWDGFLGVVLDFGWRPLWAALWLVVFFAIGWLYFGGAASEGAIKPNNAVILRQPEWVGCADAGPLRASGETQVACFLRQPQAASYPRFNAFVYSADTLLPIVDLEMQGFWIPDNHTPRGALARVYLWIHIGLGWLFSLLAVAGFSGLVKSD
ncbi:MAG: hypothetical protein KDJ81_07225 [Rhodobacteraceae bacterium]|nr:hypothetical protein [Paracoccaceae bacterium]